jgi:hypothetical protein
MIGLFLLLFSGCNPCNLCKLPFIPSFWLRWSGFASLATFASCPLYPAFGCGKKRQSRLHGALAGARFGSLFWRIFRISGVPAGHHRNGPNCGPGLEGENNANHACTVRWPGLVLGAFFGGFSGFLASRPATTETSQAAAPVWRGKITPITLARCACTRQLPPPSPAPT